MSRFVAMFHKLAADAENAPPSPSDITVSSRVLLHERRRSFPSSSSKDHSDILRKNLLRKKIIQRANHIMDLDRLSSSSWSLPVPLPFCLDGSSGGVKTSQIDDEQSIAANNEALDQLFGDIFCCPSSLPSLRPLDGGDADLFCSKQAKIRKVDGNQSFSHHWDSQLFLPVY